MDKLSFIQSPVESELNKFRIVYDASLSSSNALLCKVLEHIKQKNGKMMRPTLVFLTARLLGEPTDSAVHAAASLELLHTASLVHDDVVDESDERRGQQSVNAAFDNKLAVLTGDYMLATSLLQAGMTRDVDIINEISRLGQELSEGEILQLSNISDLSFSEEAYFDVIRKKTAALFSSCTRIAALSAGASAESIEMAHKLGEYIGVCFQIRDDIFDYYDSSEVGKPTGIDMMEGKLTLPVLYVLNKNKDAEMRGLAAKVKAGDATLSEVECLRAYAKDNGGIDYAEAVMGEYKKRAIEILYSFADSPVRRALERYVDYVSDRSK